MREDVKGRLDLASFLFGEPRASPFDARRRRNTITQLISRLASSEIYLQMRIALPSFLAIARVNSRRLKRIDDSGAQSQGKWEGVKGRLDLASFLFGDPRAWEASPLGWGV